MVRRLFAGGNRIRTIGPASGKVVDAKFQRSHPVRSNTDFGRRCWSSLEGRDIELSVSPKDIRTSPYDLCANRSDRRQSREGDRWFESISLRRRVTTNSEMRVEAAQPTAWSYDARQLRRFAHAPTRGQRKSAQRARSNRAHLH